MRSADSRSPGLLRLLSGALPLSVTSRSPSSITVVEGDTIRFTLINPEDDDHSFVLPDFAVPLSPKKSVDTTYVARHAGIFPIVCAVQSHLPMMSGQLVVLPAAMMPGVRASDSARESKK